MNPRVFDIIIVGAGIPALACACALAQKTTLSIAILDNKAQLPNWLPNVYDARVSAVSLFSQQVLKVLNVWHEIKAKRYSAFSQIEVWEPKLSSLFFKANEINKPYLGFILENNLMQSVLYQRAKELQITFLHPVYLTSVVSENEQIKLYDESNQIYCAKLAIAADGQNSWLRSKIGIVAQQIPYHERAIVAQVSTELPHQQTARQIFLDTGPLAFLPLNEAHSSSIVWSLPEMLATKVFHVDKNSFKQQLAQAFEYRLGKVLDCFSLQAFQLYQLKVQQYFKENVVLMGDAAHVVHPFAGQGLNLGLKDAMSLAQLIIKSVNTGKAINDFYTLRHYERWRKADNGLMQKMLSLLQQLFGRQGMQPLRHWSLQRLNKMENLKRFFMYFATGEKGVADLSILYP
jgi:2-polyprenylphenol 6-hydroxylase